MNNMRIAVFHELPDGGARRAVNELSGRFKKKHQVDLYLVDVKENQKETVFFNNVFFYKFTSSVWRGHDWKKKLYKDTIELFKLYNLHKNIAGDIEKKKYDLIFVNASRFTQAPFILKFLKSFKVFYCHDPYLRIAYEKILDVPQNLDPLRNFYEKLNRYLRKIIDRRNIEKADLMIANSIYTKDNIRKVYKKNSHVCYLGVDVTFFQPKRIKKDIDILFIGSLEPVDGYSLLEGALKHMSLKPNVKTLLIEKEWISDDIELRNIYRRSKVIVCLAYHEPFGLVPLEAMACEVPVIAVNEGGYKESVKNNTTGFLIPRNPKILAKKLELLLIRENIRSGMGSKGREDVLLNWTWQKSAERILLAFEKHEK